MGWGAPAAQAHAALVRSDPAAGASLDAPPTRDPDVVRRTAGDVLYRRGSARCAGNPVPGTTVAIAPDDRHELILTPPPDLPDGAYTVAWRTLSAADGHTMAGYFGFRVGAGTARGFVPAAAQRGTRRSAR